MRNRISVFVALTGLVAVLFSGAYGVAVSADSEPYEMLTPMMMPAPDTLLVNDDGALIPIQLMDAIDRYWASLFVPGSLCSLKAAMIGTFPMGITWPDCSLFVWNHDPMNQRPLEPPVFDTTFRVVNGLPVWDSIVVDPSFVTSDAFWIGYWMPNIGPDPMEQDLPACDVSPPPPGLPSSVSQNRVIWQPVPVAFPTFYHLGIRAVVSFFTLPRHDVEPTQILGVPDTVFCGDSLTVEVEVYNAGEAMETFDVAIELDTLGTVFYADTGRVTDLIPDGIDIVTFVPDVAIPWSDSTNYGILAHTMLVGDDSTANDSLTGSTFGYCLWVDDVGPLALTSPGDSVWCDSMVDVEATVYNYGNRARTFDFKILIDDSLGGNVYAESVAVLDLPPLTADSASFPPWTVPPTDSMEYTVRIITLLAGDMNAANDTISDYVYSRCFLIRDVGAVSVVVPGDTVYCDTSYTPEAEVRNFGDFTETFGVEFLIDGGVTYGDTSVVSGLGPGLTTNVTLPTDWVVPRVDSVSYDISVATILVQDMNPANDAIADSTYGVCLWMRDVGVLSVVVPTDTVYCDTMYRPEVEVQNFGELTEDFAVEFLIDGGATYGDTSVVMGLGPTLIRNVTFTDWVVPQADSVAYDISVATIFAEDMNTANDSVAGSTFGMCLWFRDVTPITIVWPGDTVVCGDTADVVAQVRNDGEIAETFSVEAVIETLGFGIYAETTAVGPVAPGETTDAVFPSWLVPDRDFLTYDIAVVTLLGLDALPANDTLTGTTYGLCPFHDGGVVSLDAPPDTVDVDSTYTPLATVHNFGNRLETFDVVCTIDGYTDTSQVADLMSDSSYQVSFLDWSAPAVGQYTMCVTSYVLADGNAANDSLCKTIESVTGVEEVRLLSPVPLRTQVFQNSPNPFSGRTAIEYAVSKEARVHLSIYDASGRLVKFLVQENRLPGYYTAIWDGKDEYGDSVPSGIYFYKLVCGKTVESRKMVMVK